MNDANHNATPSARQAYQACDAVRTCEAAARIEAHVPVGLDDVIVVQMTYGSVRVHRYKHRAYVRLTQRHTRTTRSTQHFHGDVPPCRVQFFAVDFYPRDAMLSRVLALAPGLCLSVSVTSWCCIETDE